MPSRLRRTLTLVFIGVRLVVFWGVVAALLVELGGRLFLPSSRSPIERAFFNLSNQRDPTPYTMFGRPPYEGARPEMPKAPGEVRVFILGGSTIALGEPPIPSLVERGLRARGLGGARVYNYGVVGSVTGQELVRLVVELADLAPDFVVIYGGGNDLMHPIDFDPRPGYPFNFMLLESNPVLERELSRYPLATLLAYGSKVLRYFFPDWLTERLVHIGRLRHDAGYRTREWTARIGEIFVRNLAKASVVARAFGAGFIGYFQPLVFFRRPAHPEEASLTNPQHPGQLTADAVREIVRAGFERERRASGRADLVDLSELLNGFSGRAYTDAIHPNQAAMEVIAARLAADIAARLSPPSVDGGAPR